METEMADTTTTTALSSNAPPSDTRPFSPFEWLLARRYLRARRKEGFISVIAGFSFLGIMLGVATLIIVMAVMNGFRKELFDKILGLNGHIVINKIGGPFEDYEDIVKKILTVPGVKQAFPLVEGQVMISSPAQALGALVRGLREDDIKKLEFVSGRVRDGSFDGFDGKEAVAIGLRMANALRVNLGDSVSLVAPRGAQTPFGTAPRIKRYQIAAIFELGMSEYDRTIVFMPLAEAQKYFNSQGQVTVVEVIADDAQKVGEMKGPMRAAGGDTIHMTDWRERNASFFTVLEVERNVMFVILSLIVLVAALNIVSGLMMLVKDKGRDIAILRTMGATKGAVMRVFLITGASIGVVGTLAGLVLGLLFCINIESVRQFVQWVSGAKVFDPSVYYLSTMPASLDVRETASIVLMALTLSILATLYPSWRASRLDPVEALRYE
jgi:lipoprotein-releasing system permease protein